MTGGLSKASEEGNKQLQDKDDNNKRSFPVMPAVTPDMIVRSTSTHKRHLSLLCPKREEEWIPELECDVILSNSGHNEEDAIFRTVKPYGTELYWYTITYKLARRKVEFLITASHLYTVRFTVDVC
jgi:hypothetical protein